MTLRLNDKYIRPFVDESALKAIQGEINEAHAKLLAKTGEGSDFLGWITLPDDYDKDEFVRIQAAAKKIQKSCDVFIVIGIGGSYLGSRAVIEYVKSPMYNSVKKDTPDIYFSGCNISAQAMNELKNAADSKAFKVKTETEAAQAAANSLKDKTVKIQAKAGQKGRIFGSVTAKEVAAAVKNQFGVEIDKRKITIDGDIKAFGSYKAEIKLYTGISATITVMVIEQN